MMHDMQARYLILSVTLGFWMQGYSLWRTPNHFTTW